MVQNEQERRTQIQNGVAGLLYGKACPAGCNCLATDCIECLEMYGAMEGESNARE